MKRIQRLLPFHNHISRLRGQLFYDLRSRCPPQPCAGSPVRLHIHLDSPKSLAGRTSLFKFRESRIERMKRAVKYLCHPAAGLRQKILKIGNDIPLRQLLFNMGVHRTALGQKIILRLN